MANYAGTWQIDPVHSTVGFQVKHLGIANVRGEFEDFNGQLVVDENGAGTVTGTVKVASVDTRNEGRDEHLRSADFFEAETYPEIKFNSTSVSGLDNGEFTVTGDLTIHGVTRPVTLKGEVEGHEESGMEGEERVGLSASGKISRKDFDIKFDAALGSGNKVVSDEVKLLLDVSAVKQA
jgi:polyisoprenoid-binding protein YceI